MMIHTTLDDGAVQNKSAHSPDSQLAPSAQIHPSGMAVTLHLRIYSSIDAYSLSNSAYVAASTVESAVEELVEDVSFVAGAVAGALEDVVAGAVPESVAGVV